MEWEEVAFNWALFACYGVGQVALTLAVCLPLERWRPVERLAGPEGGLGGRILYTLLSRVGVLPLVTFVLFYTLQVWHDRVADGPRLCVRRCWSIAVPALLPGIRCRRSCCYAVILDFAEYWRHRLSHRFRWWWALHSLHHAQRQMTFWSDDRNHLVDEVIGTVWFLAIGLLIGIPPLQFPLLVLMLRFLESLSHANARVSFGWLGDRLLISPRFHRAHHGVLAAGQRSANYGAILPWWDMLFRTADFDRTYVETGDPSGEEALATGTYAEQQMAGLRRMLRRPRRDTPVAAE